MISRENKYGGIIPGWITPSPHFSSGFVARRSESSNAVEASPARPVVKPPRRPKRAAIWLAVHRKDNIVYYKRLQRAEHTLLTALHGGKTLAEACEMSFDENEFTIETWAKQIHDWFENWNSLGWFCSLGGSR